MAKHLIPEHIHTLFAIDPGVSGAMSVMRREKKWRPELHRLPYEKVLIGTKVRSRLSASELYCLLHRVLPLKDPDGLLGVVEMQSPQPFQNLTACATLMLNYGILLATLELAQCPPQEVRPQKWKKSMGLMEPPRKKGDKRPKMSKQQLKKLSVGMAIKKWPMVPELRTDRASGDLSEAALLGWWWLYRGLSDG